MSVTPFFFISREHGFRAEGTRCRSRPPPWSRLLLSAKTIGIAPQFPQDRPMLSEAQRRFIETRRVGHLATADASGAPFLTPVCFALVADTLYVTVDEKPKRRDRPLKRVRNILENPQRGLHRRPLRRGLDPARLGDAARPGGHPRRRRRARPGTALLRQRYPQYRAMTLDGLPVIALRVAHVASWGDLSAN